MYRHRTGILLSSVTKRSEAHYNTTPCFTSECDADAQYQAKH